MYSKVHYVLKYRKIDSPHRMCAATNGGNIRIDRKCFCLGKNADLYYFTYPESKLHVAWHTQMIPLIYILLERNGESSLEINFPLWNAMNGVEKVLLNSSFQNVYVVVKTFTNYVEYLQAKNKLFKSQKIHPVKVKIIRAGLLSKEKFLNEDFAMIDKIGRESMSQRRERYIDFILSSSRPITALRTLV